MPMPAPAHLHPVMTRRAWARHIVNRAFGVLLIYQGIITVAAIVVGTVLAIMADSAHTPSLGDVEQWLAADSGGLTNLLAVVTGFVFLAIVRRRDVFSRALWAGGPHIDRDGRPIRYGGARMRPGTFMLLLGLACTIQMMLSVGQLGWRMLTGSNVPSPTMDDLGAWLWTGAGTGGMSAGVGTVGAAAAGVGGGMPAAAGAVDAGTSIGLPAWLPLPAGIHIMPASAGVVMTVYVWVVAPVVEEVLFRGVLMHELQPLGRNFAIFASALAFGLFHDDLVQGMFAFCAGLVFGYVAMEYSVLWSIALHAFNNGVLGGVLAYVFGLLGDGGDGLYVLLMFGCGLAALIVLLAARRREIAGYMRANRAAPGLAGEAWGSPCLVVFVVINVVVTLLSFAVALLG